MAKLDANTLSEYLAAGDTAALRAQAVVDALNTAAGSPMEVTVNVRTGGSPDEVVATGTLAVPWATQAAGVITLGEVQSPLTVTQSGSPDPADWYLEFTASSRYVWGTFGLSSSDAEFKWSLPTFEAAQTATLGSVAFSAVSNNAPSWNAAPVELTRATGQTVDFSVYAVDVDDDTLIFSLVSGPSGFSINSSTGVLTIGNSSGDVVLRVSDGSLYVDHTCTVTVEAGSGYPELFEDYSSRPFAGEPGALAVNNNWSTTVYDYVPQFAPTIPTIPTYNAGNAAHALVTTAGELATALGNTAKTAIFIKRGTYDGFGGAITINNAAAGGAYRWLLYYDEANPTQDLDSIRPWDWSVGDSRRIQMPRITFDTGAARWYVVGFNFGKVGSATLQKAGNHLGNANNIIWYRCAMENSAASCWVVNSSTCQSIYAYQCVSHDHMSPTLTGTDVHCFISSAGTDIRIVSCEGWDFYGDFFQCGNGTNVDNIMEDCDVYRTQFMDNDGTNNANGLYADGEGACDLKNIDGAKIYGNRIWKMRETAEGGNHGAGSGSPIRFSATSGNPKGYVDVRWNIIDDSTDGGIVLTGQLVGIDPGRHSVVRNIINNIKPNGGNHPITVRGPNCEVYLNTVGYSLTAPGAMLFEQQNSTNIDADVRANLFVDVTDFDGTGVLVSTATVGHNAYAGTYTVFNKNLGGTDQESTKVAMNFGDFKYTRKKLTTPETATISGLVLTTSTPSAVRTMVPANFGSRAGFGVDDTY